MQIGIVTNPHCRGIKTRKAMGCPMPAHLMSAVPFEKVAVDLAAPSVWIKETNTEHLRALPMPSVMRLCPGNAPQKAHAASHRKARGCQDI
jgi:hypothetical protein